MDCSTPESISTLDPEMHLTRDELRPEYETVPSQNPTSIHIRRKRTHSDVHCGPAAAKQQGIEYLAFGETMSQC